jgi:hypothetical protein
VSAAAVVTAEPSPSMRRAISISLPIVLALVLLPVIAFAIPADPSWIAGVYDGADGDDIVSLVCETSAANTAPPSHVGPLPCLLAMSLEDIGRNIPDRYFTRGPRSPPVLCSLEFARVFNSLPPPSSGTDASVSLPSITNFPCPRLTTSPSLASQRLVQPTDDRCSESFMISNQGDTVKSLTVSLAVLLTFLSIPDPRRRSIEPNDDKEGRTLWRRP